MNKTRVTPKFDGQHEKTVLCDKGAARHEFTAMATVSQ